MKMPDSGGCSATGLVVCGHFAGVCSCFISYLCVHSENRFLQFEQSHIQARVIGQIIFVVSASCSVVGAGDVICFVLSRICSDLVASKRFFTYICKLILCQTDHSEHR